MHWDAILRGTLVALMTQLVGALLLTLLSGQDWLAANLQLSSRFLAAIAAVIGGAIAGRRAGTGGLTHGLLSGLLFALAVSALATAGEESLTFGRLLLHWAVASGAGAVSGAIAINI